MYRYRSLRRLGGNHSANARLPSVQNKMIYFGDSVEGIILLTRVAFGHRQFRHMNVTHLRGRVGCTVSLVFLRRLTRRFRTLVIQQGAKTTGHRVFVHRHIMSVTHFYRTLLNHFHPNTIFVASGPTTVLFGHTRRFFYYTTGQTTNSWGTQAQIRSLTFFPLLAGTNNRYVRFVSRHLFVRPRNYTMGRFRGITTTGHQEVWLPGVVGVDRYTAFTIFRHGNVTRDVFTGLIPGAFFCHFLRTRRLNFPWHAQNVILGTIKRLRRVGELGLHRMFVRFLFTITNNFASRRVQGMRMKTFVNFTRTMTTFGRQTRITQRVFLHFFGNFVENKARQGRGHANYRQSLLQRGNTMDTGRQGTTLLRVRSNRGTYLTDFERLVRGNK